MGQGDWKALEMGSFSEETRWASGKRKNKQTKNLKELESWFYFQVRVRHLSASTNVDLNFCTLVSLSMKGK